MVPTEIMDQIFSFLHSDQDYTTLKTCSVVLPQIVDRHLYSQITFYTRPISALSDLLAISYINEKRINHNGTYVVDPTEFSHLLIDRPHVANYVRVVRIIAVTGFSTGPEFTLLLPVILSKLSQVESIALRSRGPLPWSTLDPGFCAAFRNCIQFPSIKEVAISNINGFPLNTFHYCKNLRSLLLYGQFTAGKDLSTSSYPRLYSLRVDSQLDLTRIVPWLKSNTLHTLFLRIHSLDGIPKFRTLIEACSLSLVSLELDDNYCGALYNLRNITRRLISLSDVWTPMTTMFPELRLPLLEHIILRSPVLMPGDQSSFLPLFASFLGSIQTISSLSPIYLTLHLHFRYFVRDWSCIVNVLVLPIFRHPIELYINKVGKGTLGLDDVSSFEQNSDMKRMLGDGKLIIINDGK
jgi:hypothetical protein